MDTIYRLFIIKALIARNVHNSLSPSLWSELQNVVKKWWDIFIRNQWNISIWVIFFGLNQSFADLEFFGKKWEFNICRYWSSMFPKNLTYSRYLYYVIAWAPEHIGIWGLFLTTFWHIPVLTLYSIIIRGGGGADYVDSIDLSPSRYFGPSGAPVCLSKQTKGSFMILLLLQLLLWKELNPYLLQHKKNFTKINLIGANPVI